jgi:ketosteroid isomerase-like protein
MKQLFFSLAIMLAASTVMGQSDEKTVKEILEKFQAALKSKDPVAVEPLLAENFRFQTSGLAMTRAQRIESIKLGQVRYGPFKEEDVKIVIYGTMAQATIKTEVTYNVKGSDKDPTVSMAYLTFSKKGDQWQLSGECAGGGCVR